MNNSDNLLGPGLIAFVVTIGFVTFAVLMAVMHRQHRKPSGIKVGLVGVATLALTFMVGGNLLGAAAANATTQPSFVLVAWKVANPDNIWETPQTLITYTMLDEPTLDALDDQIPCGTTAQIDIYYADNDSAALIAGALLYGPQNPKEPHAYVVDGDPWKFVTTDACAPKPDPRPYTDAASTSDCEWTTTVTRTGFYDLTFDPIGNVWTEATEPTITDEASSKQPVSESDKAAACAPEQQLPTLAETGLNPAQSWALLGGLAVVIVGLMVVAYPKRRNGAHRVVKR